jgi:DNA repair protein RecN (Recombination protein N)
MGLLELAVRDLALIERVRVELSPGFTVITGETGAGKSLLIDALALILGGRADSSLVRHGASAVRVEALFDREPEPLICVREVSAAGRSIARLDDETVTVGRLATEVGPLVEIHGQHDQQRLLSAAWQRDVLDVAGSLEELRSDVAAAVQAWRANAAALRELTIEPHELARRIELAEHAADEIEAVDPQPGEAERLRARLSVLASAERISALAADSLGLLGGEGGARDQAALAARALDQLARLDSSYEPINERVTGAAAELEDLVLELRRRQDEDGLRGTDAEEVEARLGLLYGLLRKYGPDEESVRRHGDSARAEADRLRGLDAERGRRQSEDARLAAEARRVAATLSEGRARAASELGDAVTAALVELGFPDAAFEVAVEPGPIDETGADNVAFLLAPNPGEPPRPLSRIASGGELSRVALAVKGVLAQADETPTLVFDEVDAGIGGRSADPVGRSLWRLARSHQVICVTHLPQIAAYADNHLRIAKRSRDGRTVTEIEPLDGEDRARELSTMLGGGADVSEGALAAARELLGRAEAMRVEGAAA